MIADVDARPDRGTVTVETAVVLTVLMFVFAMLTAGAAAVVDQLRCVDAAGAAARLLARGQPEAAERAVAEMGPRGARLIVRAEGEGVVAVVEQAHGTLPGLRPRSQAFALLEPGVTDAF